MRGLAVSLALASGLLLIAASPQHGLAAEKILQTSAVTNCMMACGSQAALCQAACVVPGTAPTGAATITSNANSSTSCQLNCSTQQLSCQSVCARNSPSP